MKILLLSAYDADSHKRWRQELMAHCSSECWTSLSLPPRYFSWRIRGNALTWALGQKRLLEQPYDRVLATSMVDLATLRGLIPALGRVPTCVYFHENQFAYPTTNAQHRSVEPQMVNLYTALSADSVRFNSDYNRTTFLQGVGELLRKLPDAVPNGVVEELEQKSGVLPVPLSAECFQKPSGVETPLATEKLTLIWNHRWEYDKGPDRLLALVRELIDRKIEFTLHVVGQQFRQQPAEFDALHELLASHHSLGAWGYQASVSDYRCLLIQSDLALSTAVHDFQGLALQEAVAAGCLPVAPRRMAYPQWFGDELCYAAHESITTEVSAAADVIENYWQQWQMQRLPPPPCLQHLSWDSQLSHYRQWLKAL